MPGDVVALVERAGPRTGAEVLASVGGEAFGVWRMCLTAPSLATAVVGRRYTRLDRRVPGYARLSPSILREFLTYTVVGLADDPSALEGRRREVEAHTVAVSQRKRDLAARLVDEILGPFAAGPDAPPFCVVVAGDLVYQMAHDVDRPERSTGMMVAGSDLDLVVLVDDDAPDELPGQLDAAIYAKKYQYLKHPAYREEIDYVVKRFAKLREQAAFDTFPRMVACKIFDESEHLFGDRALVEAGKALLAERGVVQRLREMERAATLERAQHVRRLLDSGAAGLDRADLVLFYTDDESAEFE